MVDSLKLINRAISFHRKVRSIGTYLELVDNRRRSGKVRQRPIEPGRVRLRNGAIAEVTANPRDGGWLFIRFIEHPEDPSKVGEDDMAFCTDVVAVV